jgi:hypothetical protein
LALLAGCGGGGDSSSSNKETTSLPLPSLPVPLRLAKCSDWRKGMVDQRQGTVAALHQFSGGPVGSSAALKHGPVLDDEEAYLLLQRSCSPRYARNFKLYHLYVRAAAFAGQQESSRAIGGGSLP